MDFDQLTTFVFVAKLKSFSRAGQKVFRSQSAVSAQIRQLEQTYKARLLDRSAKSVELTPAGEVFFEYAEKLLRLRDESVQVVADRGNVVQGPVVFGANEATCLYLLPDISLNFSAATRSSTSAFTATSATKSSSASRTAPWMSASSLCPSSRPI